MLQLRKQQGQLHVLQLALFFNEMHQMHSNAGIKSG